MDTHSGGPNRNNPAPYCSPYGGINLVLMANLASQNLDDRQIADALGVDIETFARLKTQKEFCQIIERGREMADEKVENALFHLACGYTLIEVKVYPYGGEFKKQPVIKNYPPNATAAIFWLKNRKPEFWSDRPNNAADESAGNLRQRPFAPIIVVQSPEDAETLKGFFPVEGSNGTENENTGDTRHGA